MTDQDEKTTEIEETVESVRDAVAAAAAEMTPEQPEVAPEPEPETVEATEDAPEEASEAPEALARPEWWEEDRSGIWEGLSRETQDYLVDREKARTEAIEKDRVPGGVRDVLTQIEHELAPHGVSVEAGLNRLINAHRMLQSNATFGIAELARQYNVDLSQFAAPQQSEGDPQQADPLQAVNALIDQRLGQFQAQNEQREVEKAMGELQEWAEAKDESGNLLRPRFDAVQHLMPAEMDRLTRLNPRRDRMALLDEAYTNVSGPPTDDFEARVNAAVEEQMKARLAEVEKAKKAAVSPSSRPSGTEPRANGSVGSVKADVMAAAAELAGRDGHI